MCSFTIFDKNKNLSLQNEEYSILSSIAEALDCDSEIAFSLIHGCLLVRVREWGRYSFLYPFATREGANEREALFAIERYAIREELPLIISDIPSEMLGDVIRGYRHVDVDAMDAVCESYSISVKTECMLAERLPNAEFDGVELGELTDADIADYARLSRDRKTGEFFGYDYREDYGDVGDEHFIAQAREEFARGIAMNFAVRHLGRMVGDAMLYAFDGRGGAHFALRLLPEARGQGLSHKIARALQNAARALSLTRLYAECKKQNAPSVALLRRHMNEIGESDDELYFSCEL